MKQTLCSRQGKACCDLQQGSLLRPSTCVRKGRPVTTGRTTALTKNCNVNKNPVCHVRALYRQHQRAGVCLASSADSSPSATTSRALFLELEGAVVDMQSDGHRAAFNAAFIELGYECISWPAQVYHDLVATGDGSPETLVRNYFKMMGWPTMLATSDQEDFVKKVNLTKQQALIKMLRAGQVPLRQGVLQVIKDAVGSGAHVALLASAGVSAETALLTDLLIQNTLSQLPEELVPHIKVFNCSEAVADLFSSDSEDDDAAGVSGAAMLRRLKAQAKQAQVQQFVSSLGGSKAVGAASVGVHPALLAAASPSITPEWLAAITATLGLPMSRVVVISASMAMTEAAATAGLRAVVVPRKFSARGTFNGAMAKFTGFGPGECTWGRLQQFLMKPASSTTR